MSDAPRYAAHTAEVIASTSLASPRLLEAFKGAQESSMERPVEEAEFAAVYCARVSNPKNQENTKTAPRLLAYLMAHKHWSPFEMVNLVLEINTTRSISAQILRHRSFSFQEFCLAGDARITVRAPGGAWQRVPIAEICRMWDSSKFKARMARAYDPALSRFIEAPIGSVYASGRKPVYEFTIQAPSSTRAIRCTREHRVLTRERGFVPFGEAFDDGLTVALNGAPAEALWGRITGQESLGVQDTYDIEMNHPTHNFVADGVVVHNSTRYAQPGELPPIALPYLRTQDTKNRQASHDNLDPEIRAHLETRIADYHEQGAALYADLIAEGVAKECAREILPLGTPTRLYMNGTARSWLHYLMVRTGPETQAEHRTVALAAWDCFRQEFPTIAEAARAGCPNLAAL